MTRGGPERPRFRRRFRSACPPAIPPVRSGRVGVLIVNLGTPEATDYWSMRRYLKEFLSDRRVIETPRWLWWPILNLVILTRRPSAKGRDYDSIWNKERNEGPLKTITRAPGGKARRRRSRERRARVRSWSTGRCATASPRSPQRLAALQAKGCDRILLVPLYPQYCAATTATVCDKAFEALQGHALAADACASPRPITTIPPISRRSRARRAPRSPSSISSPKSCSPRSTAFPRDYFDKGDPYYCHCAKTTRLLRRGARPRRRQAAHDLPVALRPRRMAQALYRPRRSRTLAARASSASPC